MLATPKVVVFVSGMMLAVGAGGSTVEFPKIDRRPAADHWNQGKLAAVPHYSPGSQNSFQVDLRSCDLSGLDLKHSLRDLLHADFDDRTVWPEASRMPAGFDRKQIMDLGRNPGLGIRALHQQGITGRGVGIAICDQPLLVDHQEYRDRIRLYEEINIDKGMPAQMHGPAVASIAVGKTVGVAPEADLYYIAQFNGDFKDDGSFTWNFEYLARGVERILAFNEQLPPDKKIRVISISVGWEPSQKGYQQITEAANKAKAAGMLVICSSVEEVHGFAFHGLGRPLLANPDDASLSTPGLFWAQEFYDGAEPPNRLLVPMDARTTASPTGTTEYVFYAEGGWSWSIPYIAGVYALAAQVEPKITPERFWALALKTGRTIQVSHEGKSFDLGRILAPAQLIEAIRRGDLSDQAAVTAELAKYRALSPANKGRGMAQMAQTPKEKMPADFAAKLAHLDLDRADRKAVIQQLGEPASYTRGPQTLDPNHLPSQFAMVYPAGVQVIMSDDRILRLAVFARGYLVREKIEVDTPLEEVFAVLGPPGKTVENASGYQAVRAPEDGVLYKDIDGNKGTCLYRSQSQGLILLFTDQRVRQIVLLPKGR